MYLKVCALHLGSPEERSSHRVYRLWVTSLTSTHTHFYSCNLLHVPTYMHIHTHILIFGIYPAPFPTFSSEPVCHSAVRRVGPQYWFPTIKAGTLVNQEVRQPVSQKAIRQPVSGLDGKSGNLSTRHSITQSFTSEDVVSESTAWRQRAQTTRAPSTGHSWKSYSCQSQTRWDFDAEMNPFHLHTSGTANSAAPPQHSNWCIPSESVYSS